ncbi:hypothetical protein JTB14_021705 [Gonioctena quinquepunctata]|nr:hypothetical protein JTB14_021705 [Gonioctena quinquepunctata]
MAPKKNYKPEQMAAALGALERGIHVSAAAKEFNVPRIDLIDLKISTSTFLKFKLPARLRVEKINLGVKLRKLENDFQNLMDDPEVGQLFNKAISKVAPEAVDILWPEIKPSVEAQIKAVRTQ